MTNLKTKAETYIVPETKNIADLDKVSVDVELHTKKALDNEGKEFSYEYIVDEGVEYRVPVSVVKQLKVLLERKPETKFISVLKDGEGMKTTYSVIPAK